MDWLPHVLVALGGYCLGSLPTGYAVGRARGVDIRQVGSGNIGATNVLRVLGKPAGIFVLLVDALKGVAACAGLPRCVLAAMRDAAPDPGALALVAGVSAILGHNYTCWLRFKGGKGIATTAGVLGVLMPKALGVALGVWLLVFLASRYVSLASVAAALILPAAVWVTGGEPGMVAAAGFLTALALYKHRANLERLGKGTEHRFGSKPGPPGGAGNGGGP
ncbi:MAG TPA: glycerol-3-phosphate 1-O-acyltransferase PlsY [Verrucomicrobiota bacterium]|nr:glycerol-3-phosphate 1-O-acyltransferase PlsY [Verrucomicrobiota bacterium]HNU51333.1 glycerol-3-phosphate 1-O-acyltransferase PlsY [Verrucomicrobiota bacterium]